VIESANLTLVAPLLVARYELVLFRMVESLNHCVAFVALKATWAGFPAVVAKHFTVFSTVPKDHGRPSEITHMVGVVTAHGVMGVSFGLTPACLIIEHEESVSVSLFNKPR
jgi:hypothetical protein